MTERHDIWKVADAIQMDLRAASAKLVTLRAMMSALDLPSASELRCDRCGLVCRGPNTLAEHLYTSHDGALPAHWARVDLMAAP